MIPVYLCNKGTHVSWTLNTGFLKANVNMLSVRCVTNMYFLVKGSTWQETAAPGNTESILGSMSLPVRATTQRCTQAIIKGKHKHAPQTTYCNLFSFSELNSLTQKTCFWHCDILHFYPASFWGLHHPHLMSEKLYLGERILLGQGSGQVGEGARTLCAPGWYLLSPHPLLLLPK